MICSPLLQNSNIRHGFFTRSDDCSPAKPDNRQTILAKLSSPDARLCGLSQIHSNIVHYLDRPWDDDAMPRGDAIVSRQKNIALGIITADCAPVLFADPQNGVIAAAHAGWKGALTGILENTIQMMCRQGAEISAITAVIGPCIAQENYEVGPEFHEKFPDPQHFFINSIKENHYLFDLKKFSLSRLRKAGLSNITCLPHDTYSDEDIFFSYRRSTHRDEKDSGRQISAIMLL